MYLSRRGGWLAVICVLVLLAGCGKRDGPAVAGRNAPPFALRDLQDEEVRLVEVLAQRPALVVFWAAWCRPCREEVPHLKQLQAEYGEDVSILAVNLREGKAKASSFARQQGITYRVLLDPDGGVAQRYGVRGIPTMVLIDRKGTIRYQGHAFEEAKDELIALLDSGRT